MVDYDSLKKSMLYLYVKELQEYCQMLALSTQGKKIMLIDRIFHFIKTGEKLEKIPYPKESVSRQKDNHQLTKDALILKGSYKNDLKTRQFFKQLIGEHFHFTAFGIDWIESRWMAANPPSYQEFADMWIHEYALRKRYGSSAKEEWMYINFTQNYIQHHPNAMQSDIVSAWREEREKHAAYVKKYLNQYI